MNKQECTANFQPDECTANWLALICESEMEGGTNDVEPTDFVPYQATTTAYATLNR